MTEDNQRRSDIARMLLERNGLVFQVNGDKLELRDNNRPLCDFYPATGRWRVLTGRRFRYFRGGPVAFINWYGRQEAQEHEQRATDHPGVGHLASAN